MFGDNNVDFLEQKRREKGRQRGRKAGSAAKSTVKSSTVRSSTAASAGNGASRRASHERVTPAAPPSYKADASGAGVRKASARRARKKIFIAVVFTVLGVVAIFLYGVLVHPADSGKDAGSYSAGSSSDSSSYSGYSSSYAYPKSASLAGNSCWEFELDGQRCLCVTLNVDVDSAKDGTMIGGWVESPDQNQTLSYDLGSCYVLDESFQEASEIAMKSGYYCKGTAILLAKLAGTSEKGYLIQLYDKDYNLIEVKVAPEQVQKTTKEAVSDAIVKLGSENANVKASIDWYDSLYPSYSSSSYSYSSSSNSSSSSAT